jgi:hypothetical protein
LNAIETQLSLPVSALSRLGAKSGSYFPIRRFGPRMTELSHDLSTMLLLPLCVEFAEAGSLERLCIFRTGQEVQIQCIARTVYGYMAEFYKDSILYTASRPLDPDLSGLLFQVSALPSAPLRNDSSRSFSLCLIFVTISSSSADGGGYNDRKISMNSSDF